jgi:hypothetical protein
MDQDDDQPGIQVAFDQEMPRAWNGLCECVWKFRHRGPDPDHRLW